MVSHSIKCLWILPLQLSTLPSLFVTAYCPLGSRTSPSNSDFPCRLLHPNIGTVQGGGSRIQDFQKGVGGGGGGGGLALLHGYGKGVGAGDVEEAFAMV